MRCPCLPLLLALGCGHDAVRSSPSSSSAAPEEASPSWLPLPADAPTGPCAAGMTKLGPGLTTEQVALAVTPAAGTPCIDIVRADLAHHRLRVLTSAREGRSQPAPAWRETFHLVAVINAGMFHSSGDPVALIVEDGTEVSANHKTYQGYLAFDPRVATDPPAVLTGRDCARFSLDDLRKRYRSIIQAPRLLGCTGEALPWQDKKQYSAAAIGLDRLGRVVLVHARAAIAMSDLANALAALDLTGALFLEGGPEASLVVRGTDGELSRVGSYETGFVENDANQAFWWLPNVLGLEPR